MSPSTVNLMDLFRIDSEECNQLSEDVEASDECLICFDPIFDKSCILKFVSQQKQLLITNKPIQEKIKQTVESMKSKKNLLILDCCNT